MLAIMFFFCRNVYSLFNRYGKILLCLEMPQRFSREERLNNVLILLGYGILRILRYFRALPIWQHSAIKYPTIHSLRCKLQGLLLTSQQCYFIV